MAGTYPALLATGANDLGRFDQFDLYAGESDIVSDQLQAADGQAISQFQVLTLDANGRVIPFVTAGDFATGTITVSSNPADADTLTLNGVALTFKTALTGAAHEVLIGGTTTITATNIAAAINADTASFAMDATSSTNVVTVVATAIGTAGNAVTMAKSGTNPTLSAANLAGADAAEDIPNRNAIAIAAQAVPATTPGTWLPVFTAGVFNHQALLWPAGLQTLADRKAVFAGTPIGVRQLL